MGATGAELELSDVGATGAELDAATMAAVLARHGAELERFEVAPTGPELELSDARTPARVGAVRRARPRLKLSAHAGCVFRTNSITDSGINRSAIPEGSITRTEREAWMLGPRKSAPRLVGAAFPGPRRGEGMGGARSEWG